MITIFTPSFADEANTNAQNLTVKEIVPRLSPEKFRVVMLYEGSPDPRIANRPNTRLLPWKKHGSIRVIWQLLRDTPDVYFFPREGPLDAAFLTLRRRLRLKTAVITYIVSGGLYNPEPPRPTMRRNVCEADLVFANCQYLGELVHNRMLVEAGIRYDGIDRRYFRNPHRSASPASRLTVLFAGSLRPYKRAHLVVRQAARHPNVNFRIVGKGEEAENCRLLAAQLGCSNITFVGHLSSEGVGEEMRRADIFFFPSILEGHPQVLGQAAACGLPAVAMNIYRPDYIVDEQTGFRVESDEELSSRLDLLIANPELRLRMGSAAAIHSQKFDWNAITEQWAKAFEEAVAKRQRR